MVNVDLLFDANNLAMRVLTSDAYNGIFINESQINNFVSAFLSKLVKIVNNIKQHYHVTNVLLIWDSKLSYRKEVYLDYKLRTHTDERLDKYNKYNELLTILRNNLESLGKWANISQEGYEADDILAYISINSINHNFVIVSNDNDFYQLLSSRVILYNIGKKTFYDMYDFQKEFGIIPEKYIYVKALAGDRSDNVVGIKGVGLKTAFKMIKENRCWVHWVEKYRQELDLDLNLEVIKLPFRASEIDISLNHYFDFNIKNYIEFFQKFSVKNPNLHDFKNLLSI